MRCMQKKRKSRISLRRKRYSKRIMANIQRIYRHFGKNKKKKLKHYKINYLEYGILVGWDKVEYLMEREVLLDPFRKD